MTHFIEWGDALSVDIDQIDAQHQFRARFDAGTGKRLWGFELADFLKRWLIDNILDSDRRYARYLAETKSLRLPPCCW